MHSTDFLIQLRQKLSEEDCQVVISAIRQDPLIWESLKESQFAQRVQVFTAGQGISWNPGVLAILTIFPDCSIENFDAILSKPLEPDLRQKAILQFEQSLLSGQQPANLEEASLVALALRERWRLRGSWQGIREELLMKATENPATFFNLWATPLACAYHLTPDSTELLKALLPARNSRFTPDLIGLCINSVLCRPAAVAEQVSIFVDLFDHIHPEIQLQFLNQIEKWGRSALAGELARNLLKSEYLGSYFYDLLDGSGLNPSPSTTNSTPIDLLDQTDPLEVTEKLQQLSAFFRFAGDTVQAQRSLTLAHEANRRLEARLLSSLASLYDADGNPESSLQTWKKVVDLVPDSLIARSKFASTLISSGQYSEAAAVLPSGSSSLLCKVTEIKLSSAMGNLEHAQALGHEILGEVHLFEPEILPQQDPLRIDILSNPADVVQTLVDLRLAPEAINFVNQLVDYRWADRNLMVRITHAYLSANLPADGIDTALIAVLVNPNDMDLHRLLAKVLEASENYEKSFEERQYILNRASQSNDDDLLAYASIALKVGKPDLTISASETCLQHNPENGLAYSLIGDALLQKHDLPGAIEQFTQATSLTPEQPGPWLALSRSLAEVGDQQKSFEVLRSAAQAIPKSAEILFALGEQSLNSGYPSEALSPLREAFSIDQKSPAIALRLGETLFKLGHFDEAIQVLSLACVFNPDQPELAFLDGQVLLSVGDKDSALQALLSSVKTPQPKIEACILVAQTIKSVLEEQKFNATDLSAEQKPDQAPISGENLAIVIAALNKTLQAEPSHFDIHLLLAETYAIAQLNQEAFDTFVRLSEDSRSADLAWRSRIYYGLGKVSIRLGQVETAIASLQEASTADPGNIEIFQSLTEAFQAANLVSEALESAKSTLRMAPDDLNIIAWYARTALSLNITPEAIGALERALQINPARTDLILWQGQIHIQSGDVAAGRQYLSQLIILPKVKTAELRKAANLLYTIEDFAGATSCLELAIKASPTPSWELYHELAFTYERTGKHLAALDSIQKAIAIQPDDLNLCVFQADLLATLDRNLAALACLEHALQLFEFEPEPSSPTSSTISNLTSSSSLALKFGRDISAAKIHSRFASLFRKTGELHTALSHAQEALALSPEDIDNRALAVELAYGLLEDELALRLSHWDSLHQHFFDPEFNFDSKLVPSVISIFAIQVDLYMDSGSNDIASEIINRALAIAPNHPRLLALRSRLNLKNGDFTTASHLLDQSTANKSIRLQLDHDELLSFDKEIDKDLESMWTQLAIAEATLDLHEWQAALIFFQQTVLLESQQPRPHLRYARALVIMAETQETYQALRIKSHAPGENKLSDEFNKCFEEEIMLASRLCASPEINHWKARGQVVFQPCNETIKSLAKEPFRPDDIASLVAGYRKTGNLPEAKKAADIEMNNPGVMFQLALALRDEYPEESVELTRKLIDKEPTNPLYISMLALSSQQETLEALKLIEIALESWPDEIEWHKFAAELSTNLSDTASTISHWKRIVEIEPENLAYTLALGQAYFDNHDLTLAIQVIEHATRQDPENVTTWKLLAKVYQRAGNSQEANNAIERAILLDPEDVESVLIGGQTALRLNQFNLATQRAKAILAHHPSNPDALLLYAQVMRLSGQPGEALKLIEQALPILNNPFQLLLERAYLLKQTQGNQAVLPYLLELIKSNPDKLDLLALLANTFSEVGHLDLAERTAQAALELSPDDSTMHLLLGHIQRMKGQLDESVHHLNEAIRQTPLQIDAYLELGRAHQERREHLQALKVYREATQVAPDDFRPFYQAGLVLRESKDYLGAENMFRRAAHLAPEDLNIRRQLGAIITLNLVHHTQEVAISHE